MSDPQISVAPPGAKAPGGAGRMPNLPVALPDQPRWRAQAGQSQPAQPTIEDILGEPPQQGGQTIEDILGPPPEEARQQTIAAGGIPPSGLHWDEYVKQAPLGRVLDAFGHGAAQGWGTSDLGWSDEVTSALRKAGIYPDAEKGQTGLIKSFNEAILRPLADPIATALELGAKATSALFGGYQAATTQVGEEIGQPQLGRDIAAMPEAFFGTPHPFGIPTLPEARALNVIGSSEGAYFGTAEPKPIPETITADAVRQMQNLAANKPGEVPYGYEPGALGPPQEAAPPGGYAPTEVPPADVHEAARRVAPTAFADFNALDAQRGVLREQIAQAQADLRRQAEAQAPHAAEIADLEDRLQDTTPRLAKKYQARLDELRPARDEFLADEFTMSALTRDTPEISKLRDQLQRTDYQMRDLAPQISAAYREVAPQFVEPEPEAPAAAQPSSEPEAAAQSRPETLAPPASVPPEPAANVSRETPVSETAPFQQPRVDIAQDVAQKLIAAGRPEEEAQAAAQLVAAHYETRAARFNGLLGNASDMYERDAPDITAGRERVRELAQSATRGKIRLDNARATITLMKNANASTFLHETGHAWLEELLNDAKDERAPGELVNDARTVREWLGAQEEGEITRAQHEKFARGFERYMMEGIAPSRTLDRVFAQFRDWLLKIYQTVARLRAPITDDIRDVFDRFLSINPEPTAIAPEEPALPEPEPVMPTERPTIRTIQEIQAQEKVSPGQARRIQEREIIARADWRPPTAPAVESSAKVASDLADIHEEDAKTTEPERAAEVADTVKAETDSTIETHAPEIADEVIARQSGGEAGGGPAEAGGAPGAGPGAGGGAETEPVSQPRPVGGGGGATAPEGARAGATEAASAQQPFDGPEPSFLDKAGNIRLELLTDDMAARATLREMAERNGEFMDARRGVVTDAQRDELANMINAKGSELNMEKLRQMSLEDDVPMAARIRAGRQALLQLEAANRAAAAAGDAATFVRTGYQLNLMQETVAAITAEWGRAGRAFHDMRAETAGVREISNIIGAATGRTLFQVERMMKRVAALDTPAQVAKFTRDAAQPGLFDWIQSAWVNGLLSGPFTHMGYTAAAQAYSLFQAVGETGAAGMIGELRRVTGVGPEEGARLGEVPAQIYGMFRGARRGLRGAWTAAKVGQSVLPEEVSGPLAARTGRSLSSMNVIPNPEIGGRRIPVGTILESPSRAIAALHSFNWTTFYEQSKSGQAFRIATAEGLEGQAFADRIAEIELSPPPDVIKQASDDAYNSALMRQPSYSSVMASVSRITNAGVKLPDLPLPGGNVLPLGTFRPFKFIDPFVQIQANIIKMAFGRGNPMEVFRGDTLDDLMMRNGGVAFDRSAGRILAGTAFFIGAGSLAAEGLLNPSGPSDPNQARAHQRIYGLPHGLTVGDTSYDMLRFGVLGLQMSVAADLWHAVEVFGSDGVNAAAGQLVHAFAKNVLDESFMRGISDIIKAVDEQDRYGASFIKNFAASFVPFSVGMSQIAREIDPYSRMARTTMDAMLAKIPFMSEQLHPRYDVWGQPVTNRSWDMTYNEAIKNDPTDRALYNVGIYPSLAPRSILGVKMSDAQYDEFARTSGRLMKMRLDALVSTPGFTALPKGEQVTAINGVINSTRDTARAMIKMGSYTAPDSIVRQATENKLRQLQEGKVKHP